MSKSRNVLTAALREKYVELFTKTLSDFGEDVYRTESNKIAFPTLDEDGNEEFIEITIKVPRVVEGNPYDCYTAAEFYKEKVEKNKAAKEEKERLKQEKIKRDKERREAIKAAKEKSKGG